MLEDSFGREVTGVRVSLTDRCNFDCVYCHNEGLGDTRGPMEPGDDEMGTDDVVRFLEVAREFDVGKVKFTGGEPMLREDLEEIIRRTPDGMETSLTTNGTFLPGRAEELRKAGLSRVNVSQDALDPKAFAEVTKSGAYDKVLEGVEAALDAGLDPVKLNMVVFEATAGYVPKMVEHVAENDGLQLQLIEYMPELTGNPEWAIDIQRVHDWLEEQADEIEIREMHGRKRYWVGGGMVEIVDPVENPSFCSNCHRVRVTHEGFLKGCLNRNDDLRPMGEMTKPEIRSAFRETVANRVPYYGEYMVRNDDGEWEINDRYIDDQYIDA
ncbi:molybdenum cofactor biosynthesis protein A [Haladaptatus paucihalophilus DX253]|uniref:Probable GTP 3',8-cyclase n=1 Tax=Haladaptatus paucihalophilus DX253 TaxID=797209 RepID=E7QSF2_HALPU|nr:MULTISPECIES: GTP 3',8-cyclase MoaA [Haladaptatus]EFW92921.1 molybdenum cofactor biosynthesis protein A [Haladaptatus paucihalophilus DX253]GKZ13483.1 GTP 3',8-cyclase MoaA [Haladaptatus sp. T7]SHK08798.1 cyclic pyranopterin monophosphate synthase subunit MoaA [Haladaptatus paucihalophilus DX253]